MSIIHYFGMLGLFSIGLAMVLLARLSQRIGHVMESSPYFRLLYVAALLTWGGLIARLLSLNMPMDQPSDNLVYTVLNDGLPALGITIGLAVVWYYWSWLVAERD